MEGGEDDAGAKFSMTHRNKFFYKRDPTSKNLEDHHPLENPTRQEIVQPHIWVAEKNCCRMQKSLKTN
jgi:hypothetical protein